MTITIDPVAEKEISPEKTIHKTIDINAPVSKVWASLTDPEMMRSWIIDTEINIISDWKVDSALCLRGDLHGMAFENKGIIVQLEPEKVLSYTYLSSLSGLPDKPENYSLITFRLTPADTGTTLIFTQSNFILEVNYQHFNFYWNTALELLRKLNED